MPLDLSPSALDRLTAAVGAKLAELTDIPLERAELLAVSVVGALPVDEDGMLVFRDENDAPAKTRSPMVAAMAG